MDRPLIYLEFKPNQIPYVNGFKLKTLKGYVIPQDDNRGFYGLFNDFDTVFKKTTSVPEDNFFYYPIIISLWKTSEIIGKISISKKVLEKVKNGACKILIVCPYEGWDWNFWGSIADTLKSKYSLEDKNFVMLTGNYYPTTKYKSVVFNFWENLTIDNSKFSLGFDNLSKLREHKFICLNRRPTPYRYAVVTLLNDIKNEGILTCAKSGSYNDDFVDYQIKVFKEMFLELSSKFEEDVLPNIPLTYSDGINPEVQNPAEDDSTDKFYNSYLYIVTETFFHEQDTLFLSEKIFKPMMFLQPFIVFGRPGTIKLLKDLGYKTFSDFWDESYDDEVDDKIRLYKAISIAKTLIKKTPSELTQMMVNMTEILEHNFKNLRERSRNRHHSLRNDLMKALI